ncbi:MAG: TIGR03790 family protein [Gammaproteobacteria bacterium]|nr:MAG: TIGR03790 family protein [Gammaproteobacteria bacterium]
MKRPVCLLIWLLFLSPAAGALGPGQTGILVNMDDPASVEIGRYYAAARGIPAANLIEVRIGRPQAVLDPERFRRTIWRELTRPSRHRLQALAVAWTRPWKVGCMSVTSALAFGYDETLCAQGCRPTRRSPYFASRSRAPFRELGVRPAMLLAGRSTEAVRRLIDRGVAADSSYPRGAAYLLETPDRQRSVRSVYFPAIRTRFAGLLDIHVLRADHIENRNDVLFYFTGSTHVARLGSNRFLPGAVGDHLTSAGGVLEGGSQMSALEWLEAGATGSYGTVTEPCNFLEKFPNPGVLMEHYLGGETLIEAYFKSVAMPGQGVFIGEPLARPWPRVVLETRPAFP